MHTKIEKPRKKIKKHPCLAEQAQFSAFFRQTEASRKRAQRVSHARKEVYKKERQNQLYPVPTPIVQAIFSSDTGGDYNKHGFMSRLHYLQRNDVYK